MITRYVLFVIINLCVTLKTTYGKKCSLFDRNTANVPNDVFENIKDYTSTDIGALDKVFNITAIESIYEEYKSTEYNEDRDLNITQLLTKYGYPVEQHKVQTNDGYILTTFRIPNDGPVVFVMHGLFCSSDDFVTTGPGVGLAYLLADAGYDVWLGNARGTKHSRSHISLSPSCAEFWDFSWDEIGRYDLPAMIDFVLNVTDQKQLVYIGHSQGTTSYFVLCSERPEYNDKIKVMIALSAVSYLYHCESPILRMLSAIISLLWEAAQEVGIYEFLPHNALLKLIISSICGNPATSTIVCDNLVFLLLGPDYNQINTTALPVIYGHLPAGIATKQLIHYGQLIDSGKFGQFDYGASNLAKYGLLTPPDYPVEKVTSPVIIFYGLNDWFGQIDDVKKLMGRLPNVLKFIQVPCDTWSHIDYLYAKDLKLLLNADILNIVEQNFKGSFSG
ncbi:lipase 3-like [Achroia grisella]|uniref:lipase 3-like n=1 Tax=Achroia grisella TaxID=688607 RepID=UPI0027D29E15|nr:lipase 3-like [Achroia grisella]